jgi:hypothetical protein
MNSHAHVILELPAPIEVSNNWDLNLSASFSSQEFSRCTRSRERQSVTNTPPFRCCPGLFCSHELLAIPLYGTLISMFKVQILMLLPTAVQYLTAPWAAHREKSWLLQKADRLRSQIMLTSLGAGSSSITCACEFISGLWGGALSRLLCACSHVEGTYLGTHSELNPRTIETY